MSLVDHIAVALDFSEPSEVAARATFALAEAAGATRVTVIHAARDVVMPHGNQPELRQRLEKLAARIEEAAKKSIDKMCADIQGDVTYEHHIVHGRPTQAIPQGVKDVGATLLVLGTHARRGLKRMFMGSIAEHMLQGLEVPALVTHVGGDGVPPDVELSNIQNVIVGIDLVPEAREVLQCAAELLRVRSERSPVRVHLVHVVEAQRQLEELVHREIDELVGGDDHLFEDVRDAAASIAREQLEALKAEFEGGPLAIEIHVRPGEFVDVVCEMTSELPAQAIVMGSHGLDNAPRFELGSTTSRMIRASDVSVLVVPSARADDA